MTAIRERFRGKAPPPQALNDQGQVTDKKLLRPERFKFGFLNILYQGEEVGLTPIHTAIIRTLGGTSVHLGLMGAIGGMGSVVQWIGTLLLRKFHSNKKAMCAALSLGVLFAGLTILALLLAPYPAFRPFALAGYLVLACLLAGATGIQWNIETSWIGDLVPKSILGWFTSVKWCVAVLGILVFMLLFGKMADLPDKIPAYALIFAIIMVSHVVAILLILTITDRIPRNANFINAGASRHERLHYKSPPFWCYIAFYSCWAGGRSSLLAFSTAYLLDHFNYSMTKIVLIQGIQGVISMIMLLIMGKVTDKSGHRIPLMIVSGSVAACMLLWVSSAWFGIVPIILYQFLNGAAGHTHSMLAINYGLEIFPAKGRSGYLAFSRGLIGAAGMSTVVAAGFFMRRIEGWQASLWGVTLNHYHLFFTLCSLLTLCCVIPLIVAGKRTMQEEA